MMISKFCQKAIVFPMAFFSLSTVQSMDSHLQWSAEDEIGIKVDEKTDKKEVLIVEHKGNVQNIKKISWDLPHVSSKIMFGALSIKEELKALTFKNIVIDVLETTVSKLGGPNSDKVTLFMLPVSNGLSFFFMARDNENYWEMYKSEFKYFKKKATKCHVKCLTFPIFYGNHWSSTDVNIEARKKVLSHLTHPSSAKIPSSTPVVEGDQLKEIDEIILSNPFTVAVVGTLYDKSRFLEQKIFKVGKYGFGLPVESHPLQ